MKNSCVEHGAVNVKVSTHYILGYVTMKLSSPETFHIYLKKCLLYLRSTAMSSSYPMFKKFVYVVHLTVISIWCLMILLYHHI